MRKISVYADSLHQNGVRNRDRIVISASSTPEFVCAYLAIHLLGAITIPVDPASPPARFAHIADFSDPKAVITNKDLKCENVPIWSINDLNKADTSFRVEPQVLPGQIADILFTSGTTGDPKGVVLTHANIYCAANNINTFIQNTAEDIEIVPLPLCHSFGLGRLRCNLLLGSTIVLIDGFSFPGRIFAALEKWKGTGLSVVPAAIAMILRMTRNKLGDYADQIRYIEIGSAPMKLSNKQKLLQLLPKTRVCMHYGLTEASRSTFIEFHSDHKKMENSIGKPTPGVQVKIADINFEICPPGKLGNIFVKGGNVMKEYFRKTADTENTVRDGWLDTGDCGFYDEQGYFYLEAREKELINVGGRKVSPKEIENIITGLENIEDCACIGIPDPNEISGEVVKCYIVSKKKDTQIDFHSLTDYLRDKIEPYKLPKFYEEIGALPKTSSGKIKRLSLKQLSQANNE